MNKIHDWIKKHRVRWCVFVFLVGVLLGISMNLLLGGSYQQGLRVSIFSGFTLLAAELVVGGTGVPDIGY